MDLNQQAKLKALQALKAQGSNPLQNTIDARKQATQQQGSQFMQTQQEMDPDTLQSEAFRQQLIQQHPELADHPQLNQMSGEQIKQLMQQNEEPQIPNNKQTKTFQSIRNAFGSK